MIQYLNVFFYDIYPYICATVFFLGSWLRYDYGQYTWRASSSQMLDKRGMVIWSNLFHIGILGIFFGHLFGMLTPHWMYAWFLPVAAKQLMAMVLGGICGRCRRKTNATPLSISDDPPRKVTMLCAQPTSFIISLPSGYCAENGMVLSPNRHWISKMLMMIISGVVEVARTR